LQGPTLEFDLLLASLVREEVIEPIVSTPFCFRVRARNWTDPESAYAADECSQLVEAVRQEQSERFRILAELSQRLKNQGLPEKGSLSIRAEIDRLQRIYEASWLELASAVGARAAETIRGEIEGSVEPVTQQLELTLGGNKNSDVEGEERCSK
jgi:hypothetical protein